MNKEINLTLEPKLMETSNASSNESSEAVKSALKKIAKKSKAKTLFKDYNDAINYQKTTGKIPVVKKIAASDPKDVRFELIKSFKKIEDAREFISSPDGFRSGDPETVERMSYLIWYVPEQYL